MGGAGRALMATYSKKRGKGGGNGLFVMLQKDVTDSAAWRALDCTARCVLLEMLTRVGVHGVNNGRFYFSVRDAAKALNVTPRTAQRAFWALQAKGFAAPRSIGHLGVEGVGKATTWTLSTHAADGENRPTKRYLQWRPDAEFPVQKGVSKKRNPVALRDTPCGPEGHVSRAPVARRTTPCGPEDHVPAVFVAEPVALGATHLDLPCRGASGHPSNGGYRDHETGTAMTGSAPRRVAGGGRSHG